MIKAGVSNRQKVHALALALAAPVASTLAMAAPAAAQETRDYAIAAGPLGTALNRFAEASGVELVYSSELTAGRRSPGLSGRYAPAEALSRLLAGTGLTFRQTGPRAFTIEQAPAVADGAVQLGPVRVEGEAGARSIAGAGPETSIGPVVGYVARRSSTASKGEAELIEVPRSVSVIGREQIEAQAVSSVQQALRYTPGVFAESSGVQPLSDNFYLRGFMQGSANPNMYLDGMLWVGSAIEPYGLERIEVLRGPASVLYGQASPGGLVNQIRKRPSETPIREIQLQGGSFGRIQGAVDLGGPIDGEGKFLYRLTGLVRDGETQIDHSRNDRIFASGSLAWNPSAATALTVVADYQRDEPSFFFGYPVQGTVQPNPNGRIPDHRFVGEPGFDRNLLERVSVSYLLEHRPSDNWVLRQNLRYGHLKQDLHQLTNLGFLADLRTIRRNVSIRPTTTDILTVDNQVEHKLVIGSVEQTLLLGVDYRRQWQDNVIRTGPGPTLDLFDPLYGQPVTIPNVSSSNVQDLDQLGIYAQDRIRIAERLIVTLGGRYDWAGTDTENRLNGVVTKQSNGAFTGQAGIVYRAASGIAPYASYSRSFLPIAGTAFGGAPFEPETGRQYEVGVKFEPAWPELSATFAFYDLRRRNVITPDLVNPGFNVQTGEIRSRGIEASLVASLDNGLNLVGAYTYNDARVTRSNGSDLSKRPFRVPAHLASLWADYSAQAGPFAGAGLGGGIRYVGPSWGDATNSFKVPGYTLFDVALHYDVDSWRFALNAANLFDKSYVAACFSAANGCNYGEGRTITGSLTYRW